MSLADRLAATSRHPTATVRLNGQRWDGWLTLSCDETYGGNIGSGGVVGRALPDGVSVGTPISWSWGYDREEIAGFAGVVSEIDMSSYPKRTSLKLADPLWRASRQQKDIATSPLNSIAASAAITQILRGAGLSRVAIPALAASGSMWAGSEWVMGTLTPVSFRNSTALAAAQKICESLGYWLYCDASGVARAALLERRPSDSPFRTLRLGVDFLHAGPPSRRQPDTRKNRVVIRGANTGVGGAQIWDAWQTGAADRSMELTFELIEYVNESEAGAASITGVAKRTLRLWDRDPNIIEIPRLKADPRLRVGMTIAVDDSRLGLSNRPFFIYSRSTTLDRRTGDFAQRLTLDGGVGDQGYTTLPAPEASFSWRLARETLAGTGVVEVFLDGTGSHSLGDGEIVSYAWSTATPVASGYPSTASGPKAMFVYPASTVSADITLTVRDTSSKIGSITQTVPLAGDETSPVTTRTIIIPLGSAVAVTPDGGATWRVDVTGDAILTPETAADTLFTTVGSGGTGLRTSTDGGVTWAPGAALGGVATAMDRTLSAERLWVGVGTDLYLSLDKGATKTLWGALPATIHAVLEDPAVLNSVFVLAGANMYHSTLDTPGTAWATLYAGPAGATARHLVRGRSGATTWVAYTGTFIGSPLQRVEGPISALFPIVSPPVSEIRALALSPDELQVFCWDAQGRGWTVDSATGVAVANGASLPAGATAQHARHDPDDQVVYLATFGASAGTAYKYLPLADTLAAFYVPAAGQQAHRIGLASPAPARASLLVPTWGVSGALDGLWLLTPGGAWVRVAPPVAGAYWWWAAANPFNAAEWLLLGNSSASPQYARVGDAMVMASGAACLWHTSDAGATWAAVPLTVPADYNNVWGDANQFYSDGPSWLSNGDWALAGANFAPATVGGWYSTVLWRGRGAAVTTRTILGDYNVYGTPFNAYAAVAGRDGEAVLRGSVRRPVSAWADAAGAATEVGPTDAYAALPRAQALPGTRSIVTASTFGGLFGVADYRASNAYAALASVPASSGNLTVTADGSVYLTGADGDGQRVYRVADPFGAATVTTADESATRGSLWIATDAATRTRLATPDGAGGYRVFDGAAWGVVAGPPGLTAAQQGNVEVVGEVL